MAVDKVITKIIRLTFLAHLAYEIIWETLTRRREYCRVQQHSERFQSHERLCQCHLQKFQ